MMIKDSVSHWQRSQEHVANLQSENLWLGFNYGENTFSSYGLVGVIHC